MQPSGEDTEGLKKRYQVVRSFAYFLDKRHQKEDRAKLAVVAAQQGAIDDAMRLWRMSTNLDRGNLESLPQLAQTKAKPQLVAMYAKMKKEDPPSTIPDLALQLLQ